jgi:teichuronic acid biosynthesis glycosyltransferase TuaC
MKGDNMNIFYITSMNVEGGGLFNATFERIKRHSKTLNQTFVINNNSYYSKSIKILANTLFNKKLLSKRKDEKFEYKGISIYNLNFKVDFISCLKRFILNQSFEDQITEYFISRFDSFLKKSDAIHAHRGWPNGYFAEQLSKRYSIPYYITFHGSDINELSSEKKIKIINTMENAEKCFFVSKGLYSKALEMGYSGSNAAITYNGVDLNHFRIETSEDDTKKRRTIGFIGSLDKKKGADYLIDIFSEIKRKKNNVDFLIIGDGTLMSFLKGKFRLETENLDVTFTGKLSYDKIPNMMNKLDVLVVPSRNEGFGMVVIEANACGIPVVGSKVGGLPEAIGYTKNIINIDNHFVQNIANRVVEILDGDRLSKSEYRRRVEKHFNWDQITDYEYEVYELSVKKLKN